jgi:hypothetical protein
MVYLMVYAGALMAAAMTTSAPPVATPDADHDALLRPGDHRKHLDTAYRFHQKLIDAVTGGHTDARRATALTPENLCISRGTMPTLR